MSKKKNVYGIPYKEPGKRYLRDEELPSATTKLKADTEEAKRQELIAKLVKLGFIKAKIEHLPLETLKLRLEIARKNKEILIKDLLDLEPTLVEYGLRQKNLSELNQMLTKAKRYKKE